MRGWLVGRPGQSVTVKDLTRYLLPMVMQFDIGFVAVVSSTEAAANLAADRAAKYRQIKPIAADCAIIQSEASIVKERLNKAIPRVRNLIDRRAGQVASFFPELHLDACPIRRKLVNQLGRSYGVPDPLGALAEAINSASFQPESINHIAGDYRDGVVFALTEGYMNGVINVSPIVFPGGQDFRDSRSVSPSPSGMAVPPFSGPRLLARWRPDWRSWPNVPHDGLSATQYARACGNWF
jgi:hypothetical protein